MKCSWKGCDKEGTHIHNDVNGRQWSMLCGGHEAELKKALDALNRETNMSTIKTMLSCYVQAGGGAEIMAKRHEK